MTRLPHKFWAGYAWLWMDRRLLMVIPYPPRFANHWLAIPSSDRPCRRSFCRNTQLVLYRPAAEQLAYKAESGTLRSNGKALSWRGLEERDMAATIARKGLHAYADRIASAGPDANHTYGLALVQ